MNVVGRALFISFLMLAGTLFPLIPFAEAANNTVVITFDRDEVIAYRDSERSFSAASPTTADPHYLEAESVFVTITTTGEPWVRIRCVEGCVTATGAEYFARWRGVTLEFPRNFVEPGPQNLGRNAIADGVPRYNGTWEVTALIAENEVTRNFNVRLIDFHLSPGGIVEPGATYRFHGRGYDSSNVTIRIDRLEPDGAVKELATFAKTTVNGRILEYWAVPKEETQRIRDCDRVSANCDRYRLTVTGGGKQTEVIPFRMRPSELRMDPIDTTGPTPLTLERTQNLTTAWQIYYPGGSLGRGDIFQPKHLPVSSVNPERALRVRIENITGANETMLVDETLLRYTPSKFGWALEWTVPKNITLGPTGRMDIQLRLAPTQDQWGNVVPSKVLGNYTITRAQLTPELNERFLELPRTEEGRVALRFKYHNGSDWTPADNATEIRGCFVRDRGTEGITGCILDANTTVTGVHEGNGTWVFKYRYPRDHASLDTYRFVLPGGIAGAFAARDKWGNTLTGVITEPYQVVPASPHIQFKTVMRGLDTQTLERNNRVSVQAVVTYGDGSPYNHTVRPDSSYQLPVFLTKRAATGEITEEITFNLTESDPNAGRYIGSLQLTLDESNTPLGTWSFRLDVRDNLTVPNVNVTTFDRQVVAAPISIRPVREPGLMYPTGQSTNFRFLLYYEDGRVVPADAIDARLDAHIHKWDGRAPVPEPASGRLIPRFENGAFIVEYPIPNKLFEGSYVFVVTGADRFGNRIQQGAISRAFTTFAQDTVRGILTPPAPAVVRGESAAVVFDGDVGDLGPAATGTPTIQLDRWDVTRNGWVIERSDVRQISPESNDHIGVFEVSETTTIGIYRFTLTGRSSDFRPFIAHSPNFTIAPTEVSRSLLEAPPRASVKGDLLSFQIERREGDTLREADILFNGRVVRLQPPVTTAGPGFTNITWSIPIESPTGNYTLVLRGRDLFGNDLVVRSPSIEALSAQLNGKLLGNPARLVERGTPATTLFGITYPNGGFYLAPDLPTVVVVDSAGEVSSATVRRADLTFEASWTPPPESTGGDYHFEISGEGASGNLFPTIRTTSFRLAPGSFTRGFTNEPPLTADRPTTIEVAVQRGADDTFVSFELRYYGFNALTSELVERDPISTSELPHRIDEPTGRYIATFKSDLRTTTGSYLVVMTGEDKYGNRISAVSRGFSLRTSPIIVAWDGWPDKTAFKEGTPISFSFVARYGSGDTMDDTMGRPSAAILYGGAPITDKPELSYADGKWTVSWTTPTTLLDGTYSISVGGADFAGNGIQTSSTSPYIWESTLKESFTKVVPGAEAWMMVIAIGLVALLGSRKLKRG